MNRSSEKKIYIFYSISGTEYLLFFHLMWWWFDVSFGATAAILLPWEVLNSGHAVWCFHFSPSCKNMLNFLWKSIPVFHVSWVGSILSSAPDEVEFSVTCQKGLQINTQIERQSKKHKIKTSSLFLYCFDLVQNLDSEKEWGILGPCKGY